MKKIFPLMMSFLLISACSNKTIYVEEPENNYFSTEEDRYTDKNIEEDLDYFHSVQKRLYDVNERGYETTTYPYCLAQRYLDKATEQYNNNDRSEYIENSLLNSLSILVQMEVFLDDIIYPENELNQYTVRKDLWNVIDSTKSFYDEYQILDNSNCGQCALAELETELINAGHLNSELGLRNALGSIRQSEVFYKKLNKEMTYCKNNALYKFANRPLYFETDKSDLRDVSKKRLDVVYNIMKKNKKYTLDINGYTDPVGSDRYNIRLSKNRAFSAYKYLKQKGISGSRMTIKAYGEKKQIKDYFDKKNYAINRRVDLVIKK